MRSKFDQQLALLNEELTQMGETCAKAIGLAAQALENQDARRTGRRTGGTDKRAGTEH